MRAFRLGAALLLCSLLMSAQELGEFEKRVTTFTLANGLHFILVERHEAPVVSFHTYINAGAAQDPSGRTGVAHLLEHLALKGTDSIGTRNWAQEKKALDEVERAYDELDAERNKGPLADPRKTASLELQLKQAKDAAATLGDPGEFARVVQQYGGVGLAARTTSDSMEVAYSLPSNRVELWFLLESQRLLRPVFRDFYQERDAVAAENQSTVETKAGPKMQQLLMATAFAASPYRNPPLGWPGDLARLRRDDAQEFFDTYCVPGNTTIAMVGDLNPADARSLAERYFGPIPSKPLPPLMRTEEPPQLGPKSAVLMGNAQPQLLIGYKRPDERDKDDLILDVLQLILASGRSGILHKELVEDKKLALEVQAQSTAPSGKYPNLFLFLLVPAPNHTLEEAQRALDDALVRFAQKPVDPEIMVRLKGQTRMRVIQMMGEKRADGRAHVLVLRAVRRLAQALHLAR